MGSLNLRAIHPKFVYIELGMVKAPKIIDHSHHKLQREIGFQVQALVAFHGKRGRMAFGKGITCKAFDLMPDFFRYRIFSSQFFTIGEKLILYPLKFIFGTGFSTHAPSQYIRFGETQPGKVMGYFDHIFLIDHDAISLRHDLPHDRVCLFSPLFADVSENILPHHSRAGYSRADNRAGSY